MLQFRNKKGKNGEIMLSTKTWQMEPQIHASSSSAFKAIPV